MPRLRTRCAHSLDLAEREHISRGLMANALMRRLAEQLGRSPSTISREIARNGGVGLYRAVISEERARERSRRPKDCVLAVNNRLQTVVACKLQEDWSPQQIAGWLKCRYENDLGMQVSYETIYRSLFIQARDVLKKELIHHLRSRRMMRRGKGPTTAGQPRGQTIDAISIRERPAEVEDCTMPGNWEGELISGSKNSHIATLAERHSRYVMPVHVAGKDTTNVINALVRQVKKPP